MLVTTQDILLRRNAYNLFVYMSKYLFTKEKRQGNEKFLSVHTQPFLRNDSDHRIEFDIYVRLY